MPHPFEVRKEIDVAASLEELWEAIATGSGIDGWFLGSGNEVEPKVGGRVRVALGEDIGESTVTAWEPPTRFAYRTDEGPDGSVHAFEYVIEARGSGRAVVRLVHSGFLADDWEAEYDAINEGDAMYLHLLTQYVTNFRGRRATVISLWRWNEPDRGRTMGIFRAALGLRADVAEGDPVRIALEGIGSIEGVVDYVSRGIIGLRTDDAMYRFLHTPQAVAFLGHHIYRDEIDPEATKQAWLAWFDRSFA